MARRGRKPNPFELHDGDEARLRALVESPTVDNRLAVRARIVLLSAEGLQPIDVADRLEVSEGVVAKWKKRYRKVGYDGLGDAPRPGRPRTHHGRESRRGGAADAGGEAEGRNALEHA